MSRIGKSIETECRLMVFRAWGRGEMRSDLLTGMEFRYGVMKMFQN